jgi:glucose/arabinose dehydrogenase
MRLHLQVAIFLLATPFALACGASPVTPEATAPQSCEEISSENFTRFWDALTKLNVQHKWQIVLGINRNLASTSEELDPIPQSIEQGQVVVRLETVAQGLLAPNGGTFAPGIPGHLFVTDQDGILWDIPLVAREKRIFLDLRSRLVELDPHGDDRGLLGVAFHPHFADNGLFYTYTSEPADAPADFSTLPDGVPADHHGVIAEWRAQDPREPALGVDPASRRELMRIAQPQTNHSGGAISFGPDGTLYIALGDGGAADDQGTGHSGQGNGQDTSNVLGDVLRIDPDGDNSANRRYGVPLDNPFVRQGVPLGGARGCEDGICDEIFAFGFRNPSRLSFDKVRGDLYLGDIGQDAIEEVDVVVKGGNYGWRVKEGSFCFNLNGTGLGFITGNRMCGSGELIDPVAEYDHDEGRAIIGGFVYRGTAIPALRGHYVFGDLMRERGASSGRMFFLDESNIVRQDGIVKSGISEFQLAEQSSLGLFVLGFGQDAAGELYVLGNTTAGPSLDPTGRPTGVVLKILPP